MDISSECTTVTTIRSDADEEIQYISNERYNERYTVYVERKRIISPDGTVKYTVTEYLVHD